jgi:hypothetical protein
MKLLSLAVLSVVLCALLTVALLIGYHADQSGIPGFMGTGIAAKVDTFGTPPPYVLIEDMTSHAIKRSPLARDGSFAARLAPGNYRLRLPNESRSVAIAVPNGECFDVVLDFRIPGAVLRIPGEGWPIPAL